MNKHRFGKAALSFLLAAIMVFAILPPLELRVEAVDASKVFSATKGTITPSGTSDYSDCFTYSAAWYEKSGILSYPAAEWKISKNGNEEQHIVKAPGTGSSSQAVTAATYEALNPMTVTLTLTLNAGTLYYLGTRVSNGNSSSWTGIMPSNNSNMHTGWTSNSYYQKAETTHTTEEYTIELAAGEVLVFAVRAGSEDAVFNEGAYGTLNIKSVKVEGEGYDFTIEPSDDANDQGILDTVIDKTITHVSIYNATTEKTVASLGLSTETSYTGKFDENTKLLITIYGVNEIKNGVSYHYYPDTVLDNNNVEICGSDLTSVSISFFVTITKDTTLTYSYKPLLVGCAVKNLTSNVATVTVSQATNPKVGSSGVTVNAGSTVTVPLDTNGYYNADGVDNKVYFNATFNDDYTEGHYNILWTYYTTGGEQQTNTSNSWSISPSELDASKGVTVTFTKISFGVSAEVDSGYTGGSASVYPSTVEINGTATFTATPDTGYEFIGWFDASGSSVSTATSYSPTITGPLTLYARFKKLTYTVGASSADESMGTVSAVSSPVEYGTGVTFTATPKTGYDFVGWYQENGTWVNGSATYTTTITANTTLVARFQEKSASVTFACDPNGYYTVQVNGTTHTVTSTGGYVTVEGKYFDQVSVTPYANDHYRLKNWQLGLTADTSNPLIKYLGELSTVRAEWELDASQMVSVTIVPSTVGGTFSVDGATYAEERTYNNFDDVDINWVATPATDYHFVGWVNLANNNEIFSTDATMTRKLAGIVGGRITALFAPDYITQKFKGVTGGTYTISGGEASQIVGDADVDFTGLWNVDYTLTATPSERYKLIGWSVNGVVQNSTDWTYNLGTLDAGTKVYPVFAEKYVTHTLPGIANGSYTLTSADGSHTVTVTNETVTVDFLKDTAYTLTITLDYEYRFNGWYDSDDVVQSAATTYEVTNFHSLVFPKIEYVGIVQSLPGAENGGYTIQENDSDVILKKVEGSDTYFVGRTDKTYTLTAIPDSGYHFVGWVDQTGTIVSKEITYVGYKMSDTGTLSPVFAFNYLNIVFPAVPGGSYTVSYENFCYEITDQDKTITCIYNADYTVTVGTLKDDYQFAYWVDGDGKKLSDATSYTFNLLNVQSIRPFYPYYGTDVTFGAVSGNGSYTVQANGSSITDESIRGIGITHKVVQNATYILTATPDTGYKFAAWKSSDGTTVSREATYETKALPKDVYAVFVKEDSAVYSVNGEYYDYLDEALAAAEQNSVSKLVIVKSSGTVYGSEGQNSFTIPANVKLIVPHNDNVTGINSQGNEHPFSCESYVPSYNSTGEQATPNDGNCHVELKVPAGNTINVVGGVMAVGGTTNGSNAIAAGEAHANVYLDENAKIVVGDGSTASYLSVCGFIYGPGNVQVKNNATMYVPFAINDFKGGGYTVGSAAGLVNDSGFVYKLKNLLDTRYALQLLPFNRYSLCAVQSKQVVEYGGTVQGYADLYAGGQFNKTNICLIGKNDTGLYNLNSEDSTATITYDASKTLNETSKIGRTRIELSGNTSLNHFTLSLSVSGAIRVDIDSAKIVLPIPYNFDIVVADGTFDLNSPVQLLPGATMTVNPGATLNVNNSLIVYDGLRDWTSTSNNVLGDPNRTAVLNQEPYNGTYNDVNFSGFQKAGAINQYPTTDALMTAGFCGGGELIVNGTLNLNSGSKFGGIVQSTSNTGKIVVNSGAILSAAAQMGGTGFWEYRIGQAGYAYGLAGATVRTLSAQVLNKDGTRTDLVAGKTYYSGAKEGKIDSYTYTLHYAGDTTQTWSESLTENVNITMQGAWCEHATWTAATCTTPKTCSVCGATEGDALGHTWTDADCDTPKTCSVCSATEGEALGHKYDAVVTEPTCTEKGYTTHTCSACGDTYKDSYVATKEHTPAAAVEENRKESTCTVAGSYDEVVYCSECGEELSRTNKVLELAAHTPAAAVEENRKESTCTVAGSYDEVVYCSVCKTHVISRETKALELAAHTAGEVVIENEKAATCKDEGSFEEVVYCSAKECGAVISRTKKTVAATGQHTPAEAVVENRTESTCAVAGSYESVVYCSVCNAELSRETKVLELAAHTEGAVVVENEKAATCTADGSYDNVVYCTICNEKLSSTTVTVDMLAHSYIAYSSIGGDLERATCEYDCGSTHTRVVESHEGNDVEVVPGTSGENNAEVTLETGLLAQIVEKTKNLYLNSDILDLIFDNVAVNKIVSDHQDNTNISVVVTNTTPEDVADVLRFDIYLKADGIDVAESVFGEGIVTVTIPLAEGFIPTGKTVEVWYVKDGVRVEKMDSSYENGEVSFVTNHFSEYEVEVVDVEAETTVTVSFDNKTGTTTPAIIDAPESGVIGAEYTFTVSCEKACVVAYTTDGGVTYTRLTATAVAGVANTYSFTVDNLSADMKFVVAIKGDVDGNGKIRIADVIALAQAEASGEYSSFVLLIGDMDENGKIRIADVIALAQMEAQG